MHITEALWVDLGLLTQALDRPETDIVQTLHQLTAEARLAVRSYLGLGLTTGGEAPFNFTALEQHATPQGIRGSLRVPLSVGEPDHVEEGCALILYAARAGAFVDLAADLSWLSGVDLSEYTLDHHLATIDLPSTEPTVHTTSVINQAIGVLIGRGHQPDEAHAELTAQAVEGATGRYAAAAHILNTLATDPD